MALKETVSKSKTKESAARKDAMESSSELMDARFRELQDWRSKTLAHIRALILQADQDVIEELKWKKPSNPAGVPVWSHEGIICTGETYKDKVKLTFARGASLKDPFCLFNSSLEGNARRAIDIREGDNIDEAAFIALVHSAVILNTSGSQ